MSNGAMDSQLTEEQVDEFRRDGYLLLPDVFGQRAVTAFQDEADRLLELAINSVLATDRQQGRLTVTEDESGQQSVRTMTPYIDMSRLFKRVAVEDLPTLLRPLLDDRPISINNLTQLNYKQPLPEPVPGIETTAGDDDFPVHADWPYFEGWAPEGIVTSILFVDDCTAANGAIEVWPGSHERDVEHEKTDDDLEALPDDLDPDGSTLVSGSAGSVLLMDARVVHNSGPNTTSGPRRLAVYRHAPESNVEAPVKDGSVRPDGDAYPDELVESTYEHEYLRLRRRGDIDEEETYRL